MLVTTGMDMSLSPRCGIIPSPQARVFYRARGELPRGLFRLFAVFSRARVVETTLALDQPAHVAGYGADHHTNAAARRMTCR
jgi:hypothetical protein